MDTPWDGEPKGIHIDEFNDSLDRRELEATEDEPAQSAYDSEYEVEE